MQHKSFECDYTDCRTRNAGLNKRRKELCTESIEEKYLKLQNEGIMMSFFKEAENLSRNELRFKVQQPTILGTILQMLTVHRREIKSIKNPESSPEPDKNARVKCV